jgi:DnaJ-class molecular chaperone
MSAKDRMRISILTLHEILDELDYYRLLKLDEDCPQREIESAVRQQSKSLHPDRISAVGDGELTAKANDVFSRIKEAGECLADPDQRSQYDLLYPQGILRMTDEAMALADKERGRGDGLEGAATHPKAEKYWEMALKDFAAKNFKGSVMNVQFAMNFEPENEQMKEFLEKAKQASSKEKETKGKNPYKLRIV